MSISNNLSELEYVNKQDNVINSHKSKRTVLLLVVAGIMGLVGISLIVASKAATYTAAREAESGTLGGGTTVTAIAGASGGSAAKFGTATQNQGVNFPLKKSANGRYLVDQSNKPFFYVADTSWTMMSYISVADAKTLIDTRKAQGFSAIQTILTPWGANDSGTRGPAFSNANITRPIESYFAGVDEILNYAESKDMVIYAVPLWAADNGGWAYADGYSDSPAPSTSAMATYMTWIGNRYKNQANIIWVVGGDDETDRNASVKLAGANALNAADPNHLITYHPRWDDYGFSNESWHDFNAFQKNDITAPYSYQLVRAGYDRSPTKPILDAEPPYEPNTAMQSGDVTTPLLNRNFGWWAALSGAMGVSYGGPRGSWAIGMDSSPNWGANINRAQATHTGNINKLMSKLSWHLLSPDWGGSVVTGGRGSYGGSDYVTAGRASDGTLIVAYTPSSRTLNVNMAQLSGSASARWYDPASGAFVGSTQPVSNSGTQSFSTPGNNAGGNSDWVLVISTATLPSL